MVDGRNDIPPLVAAPAALGILNGENAGEKCWDPN
jgi:hypothetical protein